VRFRLLAAAVLGVLLLSPSSALAADPDYPVLCVQQTLPNGQKSPAVCVPWPF
jgi:ABC-type sugar transport system substrate-binding protein